MKGHKAFLIGSDDQSAIILAAKSSTSPMAISAHHMSVSEIRCAHK